MRPTRLARAPFIKPVFLGDTITVRVTITAKRESKSPRHGMVVELCQVFNQRGEAVLACEHLLMAEKRGTATPEAG